MSVTTCADSTKYTKNFSINTYYNILKKEGVIEICEKGSETNRFVLQEKIVSEVLNHEILLEFLKSLSNYIFEMEKTRHDYVLTNGDFEINKPHKYELKILDRKTNNYLKLGWNINPDTIVTCIINFIGINNINNSSKWKIERKESKRITEIIRRNISSFNSRFLQKDHKVLIIKSLLFDDHVNINFKYLDKEDESIKSPLFIDIRKEEFLNWVDNLK